MQPGGIFRVVSDIPDYIRQTREEVPPAGFETVDDTAQAWDDWISTRYEKKAARGAPAPLPHLSPPVA